MILDFINFRKRGVVNFDLVEVVDNVSRWETRRIELLTPGTIEILLVWGQVTITTSIVALIYVEQNRLPSLIVSMLAVSRVGQNSRSNVIIVGKLDL